MPVPLCASAFVCQCLCPVCPVCPICTVCTVCSCLCALCTTHATRLKNVKNILLKNVIGIATSAVVWFLWGFAFAWAECGDSPFIGYSGFLLLDLGWSESAYDATYKQAYAHVRQTTPGVKLFLPCTVVDVVCCVVMCFVCMQPWYRPRVTIPLLVVYSCLPCAWSCCACCA